MKILALEFSSEQRSAAIIQAEAGGLTQLLGSASETGPRSLKALLLIDSALREASLGPGQIDCIAVGLGPGSYTGIRAAISVAQGWQVARQIKLRGVSSVEALAAEAQHKNIAGRVAIVIDAQRNEFYLAVYEISPGQRKVLEPLRLATFAEVKARAEAGDLLVGPEVKRWFAAGRVLFPRAERIAELASERTEYVSGDQLAPIYLRETRFVKAPPPRKF